MTGQNVFIGLSKSRTACRFLAGRVAKSNGKVAPDQVTEPCSGVRRMIGITPIQIDPRFTSLLKEPASHGDQIRASDRRARSFAPFCCRAGPCPRFDDPAAPQP